MLKFESGVKYKIDCKCSSKYHPLPESAYHPEFNKWFDRNYIGSNSKLYRIRFAKNWVAEAYNTQQKKLDEIDKRIKDQIAGYEIELKYAQSMGHIYQAEIFKNVIHSLKNINTH